MLLPELNLPINFAGKDGFYWWFGQVEDVPDPKNSNRYKVRIAGHHVQSCSAVDKNDLPWAVCMFPVTHPSIPGNSSYTPSRLQKGTWVIGFFMDGAYGQQPVIMGTLGKVSNSNNNTGYSNDPNSESCVAFKRWIPSTNPNVTGSDGDSGNADIKPGGSGAPGSSAAASTIVTKSEESRSYCHVLADAKCNDPQNTKSDFEQTLTELFSNVQKSNGQIGTQLLDEATGKLNDYSIAANGYIDRTFRLAKSYITAGKFQMLAALKKGCEEIVKFLLAIPTPPKKEGNAVVQQKTGYLGTLTQEINKLLGKINCSIEDLEKKFLDFLTNLIYDLITTAVNAATCTIEAVISKALDELESFFESVVSAIFGPLQSILSIIASPLNLIGSVLNFIFEIFGITCEGNTNKCITEEEQKKLCWGNQKKKPGEDDFAALDKLIEGVEQNGITSLQTSCEESSFLPCPYPTFAYVFTGEPNPNEFTGPPEIEIDPPIDPKFDDYFDFILPEEEIEEEEEEEETIIPSVESDTTSTVKSVVKGFTSSSKKINGINDYNYPSIDTSNPSIGFTFTSAVQFSPVLAPVLDSISFNLVSNKSKVSNGETIKFTLTCVQGDIADGTVFNYLIYGSLTPTDFVDGTNIGSMIMKDNVAVKNITMSESLSIEGETTALFSVAQAAIGVNFNIINEKYVAPLPTPPQPTFKKPEIGTPEVDDNGKIIFIPINDPGDPYIFPPLIKITGEGNGAVASAVLDNKGRLQKVLIERPGVGYPPNKNSKTKCVIESMVIIKPGRDYTEEPVVLVDNERDIARAIINENGFIVNIEVINKTKTFSKLPSVTIIGGGGVGAIVLPSLACLDEEQFKSYVSDVAPFGVDSVVDCP